MIKTPRIHLLAALFFIGSIYAADAPKHPFENVLDSAALDPAAFTEKTSTTSIL